MVADFILVKKKTNINTGIESLDYNNAIVLETKLSEGTALTTPQISALNKVKTSSNVFDIRSIKQKGVFDQGKSLGNSDNIKITDYIKVYSNGTGNSIQNIISLK